MMISNNNRAVSKKLILSSPLKNSAQSVSKRKIVQKPQNTSKKATDSEIKKLLKQKKEILKKMRDLDKGQAAPQLKAKQKKALQKQLSLIDSKIKQIQAKNAKKLKQDAATSKLASKGTKVDMLV